MGFCLTCDTCQPGALRCRIVVDIALAVTVGPATLLLIACLLHRRPPAKLLLGTRCALGRVGVEAAHGFVGRSILLSIGTLVSQVFVDTAAILKANHHHVPVAVAQLYVAAHGRLACFTSARPRTLLPHLLGGGSVVVGVGTEAVRRKEHPGHPHLPPPNGKQCYTY